MECFQTIRKKIALLGFIPNHYDYPHYPYTREHLRTHSIFSWNMISLFIFAIHVADSAKEYMESLYIITATAALFTSYTTITLKMTKLFNFFDDIERNINERKLSLRTESTHRFWYQKSMWEVGGNMKRSGQILAGPDL